MKQQQAPQSKPAHLATTHNRVLVTRQPNHQQGEYLSTISHCITQQPDHTYLQNGRCDCLLLSGHLRCTLTLRGLSNHRHTSVTNRVQTSSINYNATTWVPVEMCLYARYDVVTRPVASATIRGCTTTHHTALQAHQKGLRSTPTISIAPRREEKKLRLKIKIYRSST